MSVQASLASVFVVAHISRDESSDLQLILMIFCGIWHADCLRWILVSSIQG